MYTQQLETNGRGRHASEMLTESKLAESPELGKAISLGDLLRTIRKQFWVIVLVAASLSAAVLGFSSTQPPRYEAITTILVGQNNGLIQNPADVTGLQEVTRTMAEAVTSRRVAEAAVQQLNPEKSPQELVGNLTAERVGETQFIRVTYVDTSPENAQQVANAIGEAFSEQVANLQSATAANAATTAEAYEQAGVVPGVPVTPVLTATVWEQADLPAAPLSPNPRRDAVVALALGLMLGLGLAFLLEHRAKADNWRSPDEAEPVSGVPNLGIIPKQR